MKILDCVIIGAGPAGLTVATYLTRFRRSVIVLDGGRSRAEMIPISRNYPGFPAGVSGAELIGRLREQAKNCGSLIISGKADSLQKIGELFRITANEEIFLSKNIVLSTGIQDKPLPVDNWEESICKGLIRLCPICDAWEAPGNKVAIISTVEQGGHHAKFLRTYFKSVDLYLYPTGSL